MANPIPGLLEPGNINLDTRPIHRNPDGSISTVRSMSFQDAVGGPEILVPTIADDGTPLSEDQAIELFHKTGRHLGKFTKPELATAYAQRLHEDQAKHYLPMADLTLAQNPFAPAADPMTAAFHGVTPPAPTQPQIGPGWMQPPTAPIPAPAPAMSTGFAPPPAVPAQVTPAPAAAPAVAAPVPARASTGHVPTQGDLEKDVIKVGQDQVQAAKDKQQAVADAADASAAATGELTAQQRADAQELADRQKEVRARQQELDRQDAANLQRARDQVIPDFWAGAPGARVASIVSMAMGGIAQGILGGQNGAADVINRQLDKYFQQQKQRVDDLYKYAEMQGRNNDRSRLQYAQSLVDLKDQHAAVQQSILSHIEQVDKQNKGNIAKADTAGLVAAIQQDIIKTRQQTRKEREQIALMQSEQAKNYADAYRARKEGDVAGTKNLNVTGVDPKLIVYDVDGTPLIQASSARAVPALQSDLRTNTQALAQLQKLKAKHGLTTAGPEFHDAVLALQAVTTAGKTNSTLAHEKGAITNWTGMMPSEEAIDSKIAQIQARINEIKQQGTALPPGYTAPNRPGQPVGSSSPAQKMVTIKNNRTGETKQVTEDEARKLGAIK